MTLTWQFAANNTGLWSNCEQADFDLNVVTFILPVFLANMSNSHISHPYAHRQPSQAQLNTNTKSTLILPSGSTLRR